MKQKQSASNKRNRVDRKSQNRAQTAGDKQKKDQVAFKGEEAACSGVCSLNWKPTQTNR